MKLILAPSIISLDMHSCLRVLFSATGPLLYLLETKVRYLDALINVAHDRPGNSLSRGLKASIEAIDNRGDFKTFMQNYAYARGNVTPKGPRREGPPDEGFLPPLPTYNRERHTPDPPASTSNNVINLNGTSPLDKGRPTFGVDLNEQMNRDDVDIPPILKKCCEAIERNGLESHGLYRISGTTSKVANLKQRLDKG